MSGSNPHASAFPIIDTTNFPKMDTKKTVTVKNRWKCDVCQIACFDDYDEACRHEEECAKQRQLRVQAIQEGQQGQEQRSIVESTKTKKRERSHASPHPFFAPRASAKRNKQDNDCSTNASQSDGVKKNATAKSRGADFFGGQTLPKSKKNAPNNPDEGNERDVAVVDLTKGDSACAKKLAAIGSTDTKSKTNKGTKKNTSRRVESGEDKGVTHIPAPLSNPAETAAALADLIDMDLQEATSKSKPKKLASIFDNKKLLAEQRQVQFQAQRRMKQQQEQERQQKRNAVRQLKQPEVKGPMTIAQNKPNKVVSSSTSAGISSTARVSRINVKKSLPPLAPRFPVPSHVIPVEEECRIASNSSQHWFDLPAIEKSRTRIELNMKSALDCATTMQLLYPRPIKSELEKDVPANHEDVVSRDWLLESFLSVFESPSEPVPESDSRLWVDKFGIQCQEGASFDVLGKENRAAAQRMRSWVDNWRKARQRAMDRMAERQMKFQGKRRPRSKQTKRKTDPYDDDDYLWNDSDDEGTLRNLCLITGPPASCKSSLVHMVASQCQCTVLEINTTEVRGGTALKKAIKESTQSCSSLQLLKQHHKAQTTEQASLFRSIARPLEDSDEEEDSPEDDKNAMSSLTVILIDEVDVVYEAEGDTGFWAALSAVAKTAKCPIFLTANKVPPILQQMSSVQYEHIVTARPSASDCASKLLGIIRQNKNYPKVLARLDGDATKNGLIEIAEICNCDLRRMMHELQLFSAANKMLKDRSISNSIRTFGERTRQRTMTRPSVVQKLPRIESIHPATIPATEYSVITITGINFSSRMKGRHGSQDEAMDDNNDIEVLVGGRKCPKAFSVNQNTMVALCPPCVIPDSVDSGTFLYHDSGRKSLTTRFAPVEVRLTGLGCVGVAGRSIHSDDFFGDAGVCSSTNSSVIYDFDGRFDQFGAAPSVQASHDKLLEDGMQHWKAAMQELSPEESADNVEAATCNHIVDEELQKIANDTRLASDACLLEDLQEGIPFLSGACRGFGFDLTHQVAEGVSSQYENARP